MIFCGLNIWFPALLRQQMLWSKCSWRSTTFTVMVLASDVRWGFCIGDDLSKLVYPPRATQVIGARFPGMQWDNIQGYFLLGFKQCVLTFLMDLQAAAVRTARISLDLPVHCLVVGKPAKYTSCQASTSWTFLHTDSLHSTWQYFFAGPWFVWWPATGGAARWIPAWWSSWSRAA